MIETGQTYVVASVSAMNAPPIVYGPYTEWTANVVKRAQGHPDGWAVVPFESFEVRA